MFGSSTFILLSKSTIELGYLQKAKAQTRIKIDQGFNAGNHQVNLSQKIGRLSEYLYDLAYFKSNWLEISLSN